MKIHLLAELAMAVALAIVLDLVSQMLPVPRLPYGGSVSLRMLPIFLVAFRHGWKAGIVAGGIYGVADMLISPFYFHPIQVFMDYPIAFGAAGLAGLKAVKLGPENAFNYRTRIGILTGVVLGNGARYFAHFVSGVIFFGYLAPAGQPVWLYSLVYNGSYIVPETILNIFLLQLVLRRLSRISLPGSG